MGTATPGVDAIVYIPREHLLRVGVAARTTRAARASKFGVVITMMVGGADQSTFLRKEQPSVSRARPPVG